MCVYGHLGCGGEWERRTCVYSERVLVRTRGELRTYASLCAADLSGDTAKTYKAVQTVSSRTYIYPSWCAADLSGDTANIYKAVQTVSSRIYMYIYTQVCVLLGCEGVGSIHLDEAIVVRGDDGRAQVSGGEGEGVRMMVGHRYLKGGGGVTDRLQRW